MLPTISELIEQGALFVCNDSGGKDSQAMKIYLRSLVPSKQLIIVHAHLPEVEWSGTWEHVNRYAFDTPTFIVQSESKTFLQMVEHRKMFPSAKHRQCTSDLKRDPIDKLIRKYAKDNGFHLIVSCMGLRAQESSARAKKKPFSLSARHCRSGRQWYNWLPIHTLTIDQVFESIRFAKQEPHWAYSKGMSRLSCCFCILASSADLRTAAQLNPELYKRYIDLEERIGYSFRHKQTLKQIVEG
jgi:DNA sulfur modification protein DndC